MIKYLTKILESFHTGRIFLWAVLFLAGFALGRETHKVPRMVYYPEWDGRAMYFDKEAVKDLILRHDRPETAIDSAYIHYR